MTLKAVTCFFRSEHDTVVIVSDKFEYDVIDWTGSFYFSNSVYFLGIYGIFKFVFITCFARLKCVVQKGTFPVARGVSDLSSRGNVNLSCLLAISCTLLKPRRYWRDIPRCWGCIWPLKSWQCIISHVSLAISHTSLNPCSIFKLCSSSHFYLDTLRYPKSAHV